MKSYDSSTVRIAQLYSVIVDGPDTNEPGYGAISWLSFSQVLLIVLRLPFLKSPSIVCNACSQKEAKNNRSWTVSLIARVC